MKNIAVTVNAAEAGPQIKPLHGINNAPISGTSDLLFHFLGEAGIPSSRLHDTGGRYGGGCFVDIENIFRNFDADPEDPASYDFAFTDWLLTQLHEQGVEPFYRLGATIENSHYIKAYHIFPPKDNLQWAKICEGIIRHYNEGWADGFQFGIRYWEIWNEPENSPDIDENPMWKGTKEQYFQLYEVTSNYLKKRFPHLKIGGYAGCGFYALTSAKAIGMANTSPRVQSFVTFFKEFLDYISSPEHKSPLDFFSWHSYAFISETLTHARFARETLDQYGFSQTESILNEWNPGIAYRGETEDASRILAVMCAFQNSSVDRMNYYDGQVNGSYCGMFDPVKLDVFPAYYAFPAFDRLYRLGTQIGLSSSAGEEEMQALAATDGKGTGAVLLINLQPETVAVGLQISGLDGTRSYRSIDSSHLLEEMKPQLDGEGRLLLPPHSVLLVEIQS